MAEKFTDEQVTDKVLTLVAICWRSFTDALFERFDQLHKLDIHDDQVIRALRKIGEVDLASEYIDWADAVDPDVEGGDETDVVPDPASAESYKDHPLNRPRPYTPGWIFAPAPSNGAPEGRVRIQLEQGVLEMPAGMLVPKDTRQKVLEALIGHLSVERDQNDLWFDYNHLDEVVLDGRVDFQKLADAVVKAVGE